MAWARRRARWYDDDGRGDPTAIDPATNKFERGDPTQPPDATEIQPPRVKHPTGGTLRRSAALRRKRGLAGDVRYVFTALFGVRSSRRELAELEHRQDVRQTSRRRHLVTLGRAAAVLEGFESLDPACLILTKWDETDAPGESLSLAIERGIPIARITVGQEVPDDIRMASSGELARSAFRLEPLTVESRA